MLKKKKVRRTREDAIQYFFIRFITYKRAQFAAKFLTNTEYNNLHVYFLIEERVNSKKTVVEGTQNRIKKYVKIDVCNFDLRTKDQTEE